MKIHFGLQSDPVEVLLSRTEEAVLAVIVTTEGPSYRPLGAMMAIFPDGQRVGSLSSGCIEADLVIHAIKALSTGQPMRVRYGWGSPFMDIQLPCGGGLEILLLPRPDKTILAQISENRKARVSCTLGIELPSGALSLETREETGFFGDRFCLRFLPEIRFLVFGKGPEAETFSALVQSAGFPNLLLSPDAETLEYGKACGCQTRLLKEQMCPNDVQTDPWTAVVLFFHDHDWEPPILKNLLSGSAFYIGAQGSQRARDARNFELQGMGVPEHRIQRIHGPIGLIASARDARTLAVSVLAEVLAVAKDTKQNCACVC